MASPRHAAPAPDDEPDLAELNRAWRRYLAWIIAGIDVAVLGLVIFGYLGWWSMCGVASGTCGHTEPAIYWGSTISAGLLGGLIGLLLQGWLDKRTSTIIAISAGAGIIVLMSIFWLLV